MKNIIIAALTAFIVIFMPMNSAAAAEFKVSTFNTTGNTFITMNGETVAGDLERLNSAIHSAIGQASSAGKKFSGVIFLTGPGGLAHEGKKVAERVRAMNMTTVAWNDCISACSLIWAAGAKRDIHENSTVQIHPPYVGSPEGIKHLKEYVDAYGLVGLQTTYAKTVLEFMTLYFEYGVSNPVEFMRGVQKTGPGEFFVITKSNLHIMNY